jgi:hypothetical protein
LPNEILVTTNRYAIATVPLNSVSDKWKVVFCQSVGLADGYCAGRGIQPSELQRIVKLAVDVGKEIVHAADIQVEKAQNQ